MIRLVVPHSAAAGNFQYTIRVQDPGSILTAGAGSNFHRLGGSCHIGNAVLLGIALGIGVLGHRQGHTLRCVQEDICTHAGNTVGNIKALQARVALEHIFAHAG